MRYFLAVFFPPLAILACGKPIQALFSFVMMVTCFGWPLSTIWALCVVANFDADRRHRDLVAHLARPASIAVTMQPGPDVPALSPVASMPTPTPALKASRPPNRPAGEGLLAGFAVVRETLAVGYGNLPEWSQPIIWGLAAAAPISAILILAWARARP
jgi:uncharacterized membrane protein YqaE (UPF0057 family)